MGLVCGWIGWLERKWGRGRYRVIQDMLVARVVVDIYRDAAKGGNFGGEFGEEVVVLSGWGKD